MTDSTKGSKAAFSFLKPPPASPLPGLAASAARRLPRWAFLWLLVLYVGHGLFNRDPWRGDDLIGIALARSTAEALLSGNFSVLLLPQMEGYAWNAGGPVWTAILAIFTLPVYAWSAIHGEPVSIGLIDNFARMPLAIAMALGLTAIWKATDRFARRREAQPVDPLGVGPNSRDFGKTLADCALLLSVATLGVVYPWHQAGTASVGFLLEGLLLWALATAPETPKRAAMQSALIVTASLLTLGVGFAIANMVSLVLIFQLVGPYRLAASEFYKRFLPICVVLIGAWIAATLWWLPMQRVALWWNDGIGNWTITQWLSLKYSPIDSLRNWIKDSLWKWWPLWPVAAFGLWKVRNIEFRKAPHWMVPLIALGSLTLLGLIGPSDWKTHQLIPVAPLAMIAAFAILSLSRPIVNLIDWFAVTLFTALGIFIWLYWFALNFGFPTTLAKRVAVIAPGVKGSADLYEILIGIAATLAWVTLVAWRVRRGSPRLWRPVVLSAGGITLAWVLLTTLWLPAIDRIQGQQAVARSLESGWIRAAVARFPVEGPRIRESLDWATTKRNGLSNIPQNACVRLSPESSAINAMAVALTRLPIADRPDCAWQLALFNPSEMRDVARTGTTPEIDQMQDPSVRWKIVWQSSITEDRKNRERFVLLERTDPLR